MNTFLDDGCACTGTLIAPSLVLTAKHCGTNLTVFETGPSFDAPVETRTIDGRVAFHADEGTSESDHDVHLHDLQIVHLASPIYDVRPLPINTGDVPSNGTSCIAVGYGFDGANNTGNVGTKRSATVVVAKSGPIDIELPIIGTVWAFMASMIQEVSAGPGASPPGGVLWEGDSGGPLLCNGAIAGVHMGYFSGVTDSGKFSTALDSTLTHSSAWITDVAADYVNEPMVSAVSWSSNRIDLFVRGTDGALYHKAWDKSMPLNWDNSYWHPSQFDWEYLGGFISGTPETVTWGPNRLDIFMRGGDPNPQTDADGSMELWHLSWNGSGWNWQDLGGILASRPAAVSWGPGRIDIFGMGTDGAMYHMGGDGQSFPGGWQPVPGGSSPPLFAGPVKAISVASNEIDIYAVGVDQNLYHTHYRLQNVSVYVGAPVYWITVPVQAWEGHWDNLGGPVLGTPALASWGGGREDIFVKMKADNAIYQKTFVGGAWLPSQSGFTYLGGKMAGSPAAASYQSGWLTLIGMGWDSSGPNEGTLYKGWFSGTQWFPSNTGWWKFGDPLGAGSPALLAMPGVGVQLFTVASQFTPYINGYSPTGPSNTNGWSAFGSLGGTISW